MKVFLFTLVFLVGFSFTGNSEASVQKQAKVNTKLMGSKVCEMRGINTQVEASLEGSNPNEASILGAISEADCNYRGEAASLLPL